MKDLYNTHKQVYIVIGTQVLLYHQFGSETFLYCSPHSPQPSGHPCSYLQEELGFPSHLPSCFLALECLNVEKIITVYDSALFAHGVQPFMFDSMYFSILARAS